MGATARFPRDNGLSLAVFALFAAFLGAQSATGWLAWNEEQAQQGGTPVAYAEYVAERQARRRAPCRDRPRLRRLAGLGRIRCTGRMANPTETEARETYERFVALRDQIDVGEQPWSALADFFTEDAAYIDPAWGRIEGRESIREFFEKSMAGLTGHGWETPENWIMVDGPRVVVAVGPDPRPQGGRHAVARRRVSPSSTTPGTGSSATATTC